jgi:hypothetical protein
MLDRHHLISLQLPHLAEPLVLKRGVQEVSIPRGLLRRGLLRRQPQELLRKGALKEAKKGIAKHFLRLRKGLLNRLRKGVLNIF